MIKPWKHQESAVEFAMLHRGVLFDHDMGVGKTITSILLAQRTEARRILILCPKPVVPVWEHEFNKFCSTEFNILSLNKGSVKKKAEHIDMFLKAQIHQKKVVVVNFESAWRENLGEIRKNGRISNIGLLRSIDWDLIIIDECHKIAHSSSKISKFCGRLAKATKKIIGLSGTPLPNGCLSAHGLCRTLKNDLFDKSEYRFKMKYAQFGGFENREVLSYINQTEFKQKFASITHSVKAEEVIELPHVVHINRNVDLSPKAMKMYKEFQNECILEIDDGIITAENVLVKYLRLAMIASGSVKDEEGNIHHLDNSKIETVKDIIDGLPSIEPIIVFGRFVDEIRRAKEILQKDYYTCSELSGQTNQLANWQRGETQILLANIQAGAVGIDCTRARYCIYLSTGYSYVQYSQSLARICRPGADLKQKIFYYHINANHTIDKKITKALNDKENIIETLLKEMRLYQ